MPTPIPVPTVDDPSIPTPLAQDAAPPGPVDPVLQAFYGNDGGVQQNTGFDHSGSAPAPTGNAGLEWAPKRYQPPPPPSASAPQDPNAPTSGGSSMSASFKGVTDHGLAKAHGEYAQADQRADGQMGKFGAELDRETADATRDYGSAKEANGAIGLAEKEHADNLAALEQHSANLQKAWAEQEQNLRGEAKAHQARILDRYQGQLAGVAQLAQSTGNPIDDLSRTQAFGLAGAMFAQGFLATRGYNINVGGEIDKWVDTSIKTHQQSIVNARDAANATMHLYEVARQGATDDADARLQYRGMVLAGLSTQVNQEAARFQSGTAMSRAQLQNAQIGVELDKTKREIGNRYEQQYIQIHSLEYKRASDELQKSIEMAKIGSAERLAAVRAKAEKVPLGAQYVFGPPARDPDGVVRRHPLGKVADMKDGGHERLQKANEAVAAYSSLLPEMKTYASALATMRANKTFIGTGGLGSYAGKLDNPDYQRALAARDRIAMAIGKLNYGTRISDTETDRVLGQIPMSKYLDGNDAVFQDVMDTQRNTLNANVGANTDSTVDDRGFSGLTDEERKYWKAPVEGDKGGADSSHAFNDPTIDRHLSKDDQLVAEASQSKKSTKGGSYLSSKLDALDPEQKRHEAARVDSSTLSKTWVDAQGGGTKDFQHVQPGWAHSTELLAFHALDGDADAVQGLRNIADDQIPDGGTPLPSQRRYAKYLLTQIESDPKGLSTDLKARQDGAPFDADEAVGAILRTYNDDQENETDARRAWAVQMEQMARDQHDRK